MIRTAQRRISTSTKTNAKLGLAVEKANPMMEGLEGRRLMSSTTFVSDLTPTSAVNGWGPYEKDMSVGDKAARDGGRLNIAGTKFSKGLGVHANSTLTYNLNGQYNQFLSSVGVDSEIGRNGSVVFQAYLDGKKVYDSGKMTGGQKAKNVSLNTTGAKQLKLVVTDAGNGNACDHADWGNARLVSNSGTTTPTNPTTPTGDTPIAPTNLTATAASSSQINLSWKDNSNIETGYKIERSTDGKTFSQIGTVGANVSSFQSTGLTAGTKYYYRVRATNDAGNSAYTNIANATTQSSSTTPTNPTPTAPAAPSNLTATAASTSAINLKWTDNANNESGVKIERSTDGKTFSQVGLVGANVTSFQDTKLSAGTKYYYRVRSTNSTGDSAYTSVASATTQSSSTTPTNPTTGTKPDASNTGPTDASALKSSGSITVTQNGAVIENVDVNGTINVNASNVTIRNFRVHGSATYGINIADGVQNVTIEDGEITGVKEAGIYGPNFTARRLNIHDVGADGIKPWSNVTIDSNYIHDLGLTAGAHADGIQASGGSNITITNNNIDAPNTTRNGVTYRGNSAVFLHSYFGPIQNVKVDHNWLGGGSYTVYAIDAETGYGNPTGVSITNNQFYRDSMYGPKSLASSGVTWSSNKYEDNGQAV